MLNYLGVVSNCNLDTSKGEGVCVDEDIDPAVFAGPPTGNSLSSGPQMVSSTFTTTYTGPIVPWATVTTSSGSKTTGNSVVTAGIAVLTGILSGVAFILV